MNFERAHFGIVGFNDKIYVCGGTATNDEQGSQTKFECFDLATQRWMPLQNCKIKATGCSLCKFRNSLILKIGGKKDMFTEIEQIEFYDLEK
jgi:hypothetical protein